MQKIKIEIKASVAYQYYGQKYSYKNEWGKFTDTIGCFNTNEHLKNDSFKLFLKPLSEITDEEVFTVMELNGHCVTEPYGFEVYKSGILAVRSPINTTSFQSYQFLQSRGYDLPNFYLSGKTLFECGLCIYNEK